MNPFAPVGPPVQTVPTGRFDVSDPLADQVVDTIGDQQAGRALPRALTPFRSQAYRRLAVALVLSTFAGGVWIVALVWEVIALGGGPAQLSIVSTAGAIGVLLPALVAGVVADRVPQKSILLVVALVELVGIALIALLLAARPHPGLAPRRGLVLDRRRHGLLLPRLLRLAAGAGRRVRPAGGQRLRGHGPAHGGPGDRPRRGRCRRRSRLAGGRVHDRDRRGRARAAGADRGPRDRRYAASSATTTRPTRSGRRSRT